MYLQGTTLIVVQEQYGMKILQHVTIRITLRTATVALVQVQHQLQVMEKLRNQRTVSLQQAALVILLDQQLVHQ